MADQIEVPRLGDLDDFPTLEVVAVDLGVVTVTAQANDGATVAMTWDELAGSVQIRWLEGEVERVVLERESAAKISVREQGGTVEFWIWSAVDELRGTLVVRVGESVTVQDALLRS